MSYQYQFEPLGHQQSVACLVNFFAVVVTYYSLFWVPVETVTGAWSFFFLRILPLTLMYIATYQLYPENAEGTNMETFMFKRIKEMLIPMILYNILGICKTVYYRLDEYLELGNGNILNSSKFWLFVSPSLSISVLAFLMVSFFPKKRLIEAFIVFSFLVTMALMTFGATERYR